MGLAARALGASLNTMWSDRDFFDPEFTDQSVQTAVRRIWLASFYRPALMTSTENRAYLN